MADLRLVLVQARAQLISTARNRRAMVVSLVLPVVILVLFNSIFGGGDDTVDLAGARITTAGLLRRRDGRLRARGHGVHPAGHEPGHPARDAASSSATAARRSRPGPSSLRRCCASP